MGMCVSGNQNVFMICRSIQSSLEWLTVTVLRHSVLAVLGQSPLTRTHDGWGEKSESMFEECVQLALRQGVLGVKMEAGERRAEENRACLISAPSKGVNERGGFFIFFWPARVVTAEMIPHRVLVLCIPFLFMLFLVTPSLPLSPSVSLSPLASTQMKQTLTYAVLN